MINKVAYIHTYIYSYIGDFKTYIIHTWRIGGSLAAYNIVNTQSIQTVVVDMFNSGADILML